jgi:hypothetical protein
MNDEQLLQLIAVSDPVPSAATLHPESGDDSPLLLAIYQRSGIMGQRQDAVPQVQYPDRSITKGQPGQPVPEKTNRRWRGPAVAAAAFAIVAVVGMGAWLASSGNGGDVADQPASTTTALASAELLRTAFNQGDFETYRSLFAPDAGVGVPPGAWDFLVDLELEPLGAAPSVSPAAFGLQLEGECTEDNPSLVTCTWTQRGGMFDRVGIDMTSDVTLYFDVEGAIYNLVVQLASEQGLHVLGLAGSFHPIFGAWLRDTHPDVFAATYTTPEELPRPLDRDHIDKLESRAQWAAVLDEFLAQSDTYPLNE